MKILDPVADAPLRYDPNHFVDQLSARLKVKNDAALCRQLGVSPPLISKIRHQRLPIGASLLIRVHEVTGLAIGELRTLMGDRRSKYRIGEGFGRIA
jgi:transcriptional regulator with XRE-family HTH domain